MKWLKMDCDAQENLDMKKLIAEWGWAWYGRYWAILCKIGMLVTEKQQTFALQTNNDRPFPVQLLSNDLGTTVKRLLSFCQFLANNDLIDADSWNTKNLIYCPKMRKRTDDYTKKVLTLSRHCPDQEVDREVDREVEKEKEKKKKIALCVDNSLDPQNKPLSFEPVRLYFTTGNFHESEIQAHIYFEARSAMDWKVGRYPIRDWRADARAWIYRGQLREKKRADAGYTPRKRINTERRVCPQCGEPEIQDEQGRWFCPARMTHAKVVARSGEPHAIANLIRKIIPRKSEYHG